ncbi:hypothetical protein Bhyg_09165, partial [Pseudolycoriella hygida]
SSIKNKPKKRYRAASKASTRDSDSDTFHKFELMQSSFSECTTKVTSTTTVRITTEDDSLIDALDDLPDFINDSVIDQASTYVRNMLRQRKRQKKCRVDFDLYSLSSTTTSLPSWLEIVSKPYINLSEAYKQLNTLLKDGTTENLEAITCD